MAINQLPQSEVNTSVSSATLKTEDLLPCFLSVLQEAVEQGFITSQDANKVEELVGEHGELTIEAYDQVTKYKDADPALLSGFWYYTENSQETAGWMLHEDCFDLLNELAPEGTYFGAHPGDGADIGFWQFDEEKDW
ncbi:MAG: hypothetical protein GF334_07875 [Candidatus Altiarchaeales archaeon]|nr:hypothetical protein [Candidatus Altiarchaeales archaeon]